MVFVCAVNQEAALASSVVPAAAQASVRRSTPWFFMFSLRLRNARLQHVGRGGRHGAVLGQPRE